jgi:hypothetical protein
MKDPIGRDGRYGSKDDTRRARPSLIRMATVEVLYVAEQTSARRR